MKTNYPAITVENVAKVYRLGSKDMVKDSIGGMLMDVFSNPLHNLKKYRSLYKFTDAELDPHKVNAESENLLWALRDVSFEVQPGEVVGIIGMNGAGKSTLLKVLSRITAPTIGKISIRGRVSSLLEVGTGFHPELTGRENTFLNGTILGMRKKEVEQKFDEIVEFSGVEKFLDTPVKRYSSGMRVRLAFAVAAHLEPEILIIDEVLAVGDAAFQKKCLDKMEDVGRQGRTVLFVSHSMPAVTRMCERVIMLNDGQVMMDGDPHEVIRSYLTHGRETTAERVWTEDNAPRGSVIKMCSTRVMSEKGEVTESFDIRKPIVVEMEYEVLQDGFSLMPSFSIFNDEGNLVLVAIDQDRAWMGKERAKGIYKSRAVIPGNLLGEEQFAVNMTVWTLSPVQKQQFYIGDALTFGVVDSMEGDSARGMWKGDLKGSLRPAFDWSTELSELK